MNASITDASGSRSRGNAVLRISFPPPDDRPGSARDRAADEVEGEEARAAGARRTRPASAAAEDVDQHEVDEPSSSGLRISQSWPEARVEVLRAQVRARQLESELAPRHSSRRYGPSGGSPTRCGS